MIGMSVRAFLLYSVNFCLHVCYFALDLGQLVCSVQRVLLDGQLLGEVIFLLFQGLELEAQGGELILVGPRGICTFGNSVGWVVVICWGLCGKVFLRGSGIILGVTTGGSVAFLFVCASKGWFTSSEHGVRHCGVLCFFTTQAKCIHKGRIKRGGRVSPSYMHVSSTGWLGGIYTPNLYYTMASIPLPAQNILRIFRTSRGIEVIM